MTPQPYPRLPILIVDDEEDVLLSYAMTLRMNRIDNFELCSDSREVVGRIDRRDYSTLMLDMAMPHINGFDIIDIIRERHPEIVIIVVTGSNSVDTAVECMKRGVFDYLLKPVESGRLVTSLRNASELGELRMENSSLRTHMLSSGVRRPELFSSIISVNESMRSIFSYIEAIAPSPRPVLITGESGTGKELVARAVHAAGRRTGRFVAVNVGGLDDTMFSDALFGHRKGAFTGADADRRGLIENASGGTLFLDEIGTLQPPSQVKLLRLLQESEYYALGADSVKRSEASVIAATNENIEAAMVAGTFRNDLYYRLMTHHIHLPALRERLDDLPLLVSHFAAEAATLLGKTVPVISSRVIEPLRRCSFPGNVRELQALVFDAVTLCNEREMAEDAFKEYAKNHGELAAAGRCGSTQPMDMLREGAIPHLRDVEDYLIAEALRRCNNSQTLAAEMLGISQSTLSRRIRSDGNT